jgi:hypothetical protein
MPSPTLPTRQTRQAVCQPQPLANSGSAGQTSQPDSQNRAPSGPSIWDSPLAERFQDSGWPEAKTVSDEAAGQLEESRGQPDRATQNVSAVSGGRRNLSRPHPHIGADTRRHQSRVKRIIYALSRRSGHTATGMPAGGLATEWNQKTSQGS